jgi:hypothetical protein
MQEAKAVAGASDFDFFIGDWSVLHRQRRRRLAGNDEWIEFGGTVRAARILNGSGNIDDNLLEHPGGAYRAATLRSFDPASGKWSIWWLDGRRPGRLDVPMVGSFSDGVGRFYADDMFEGRPIRVRFLWTQVQHDRCRWEQAFSGDGGVSWETNWIMEFSAQARL